MPGLSLGTADGPALVQSDSLRRRYSVLQTLSAGELHIGMGRGTANLNPAFGISMETAVAFSKLRNSALGPEGEPFTFDGEFVNSTQLCCRSCQKMLLLRCDWQPWQR